VCARTARFVTLYLEHLHQTVNTDGMRMIIRKLNNVDEKMDVMLRKINRLANKSQVSVHATAADEVDAPCLPPGICLPADWTTGCGDMAI